jgi:hypothetical protein
MELEQHHIIKFLNIKGLKLGYIAVELSSLDGQDAYTRSSLKYCLHEHRLGRKDVTTWDANGRPPPDDTDTDILLTLRRSPFSWVRTIAGSLSIPASTGYWHFVEKIGFQNYFLRRVPHALTDELRHKRSKLAGQFLELLES